MNKPPAVKRNLHSARLSTSQHFYLPNGVFHIVDGIVVVPVVSNEPPSISKSSVTIKHTPDRVMSLSKDL